MGIISYFYFYLMKSSSKYLYQLIVGLIVGIVFNNVVTGNESTPANNQNNIWWERILIVVPGMYMNLKIYQL
jgi:hypothetical protein